MPTIKIRNEPLRPVIVTRKSTGFQAVELRFGRADDTGTKYVTLTREEARRVAYALLLTAEPKTEL